MDIIYLYLMVKEKKKNNDIDQNDKFKINADFGILIDE